MRTVHANCTCERMAKEGKKREIQKTAQHSCTVFCIFLSSAGFVFPAFFYGVKGSGGPSISEASSAMLVSQFRGLRSFTPLL